MNKWTWLILILFLVWAIISWRWYVCGVKGFCGEIATPVVVTKPAFEKPDAPDVDISISDVDVTNRPDENIDSENEGTTVVSEVARILECSTYLDRHIKLGAANSATEVVKLERFLTRYEGESLEENGVYEVADEQAVKRFQEKYRSEVLEPWGLEEPTGYVFRTTRDHINRLYCAYQAQENN